MFAHIKVENKIASIRVYDGWGNSGDIKLVASTFPIVPSGTIVERFSTKVPDGLHAAAFYCKVDKPRVMGSGKTRYIDRSPLISGSLLLSWQEGDKTIVKDDEDMSGAELARFNPFVRANADVLVVDPDANIAYVPEDRCSENLDPNWTYDYVSMHSILEYITKRLTLEGLRDRVVLERIARDQLSQLRDERDSVACHNSSLTGELDRREKALSRFASYVLRRKLPLFPSTIIDLLYKNNVR